MPKRHILGWQVLLPSVLFFQLLSCVRLFATPWIAARQASLSITNSWTSLSMKISRPSRVAADQIRSDQSLSRVWLSATPWIAARQASLSITNSWTSLKLNVHQVGDAIQPSHPLSSPSPPAPSPSQHQSLFQWINSSHEVAKVLEFQLQHQSSKWRILCNWREILILEVNGHGSYK